jgi:hypothetical protein
MIQKWGYSPTFHEANHEANLGFDHSAPNCEP